MLRSNPEWRTEWKSLANGVFEESWDRVVGDSISRAWRSSARRAAIGEEERPLVHPICFLEFLWPRLYHRTNCRDILGKKGWFPVISSAFLVLKRFILFLFVAAKMYAQRRAFSVKIVSFPFIFQFLFDLLVTTCPRLASLVQERKIRFEFERRHSMSERCTAMFWQKKHNAWRSSRRFRRRFPESRRTLYCRTTKWRAKI